MSEKDENTMLEETDLIEVGHGNIGTFNKAVYVIISIICLLYLVLFFRP
jgi:hypothetical protein